VFSFAFVPKPFYYLLLYVTNIYKYSVINLLQNNFLVVRFTHGSGGKFLSTVLQTSAQIDHWSGILESKNFIIKQDGRYEEAYDTIETKLSTLPKKDVDLYLREHIIRFINSLK
jgi:hypothetical protein